VKYKAIKSMAHNFSHSFVSYQNYVDDGYVIDDLLQLVREADGGRVTIRWIPEGDPHAGLPERVRKSIALYRAWLPGHLRNHGVDRNALREFRTEICLRPSKQVSAEAYVLDDRGREHVCRVAF
jgi:hypothetical protein